MNTACLFALLLILLTTVCIHSTDGGSDSINHQDDEIRPIKPLRQRRAVDTTTTAPPATRRKPRRRTHAPYEPLEVEEADAYELTTESSGKKTGSSQLAFYIVLGIGIPAIILTAVGFYLLIYCRKRKPPKPKTASQQANDTANTIVTTPTGGNSNKQLPPVAVAIVPRSPIPTSATPKARTPPQSSQPGKDAKEIKSPLAPAKDKLPKSSQSSQMVNKEKEKSSSAKSVKVPKKERREDKKVKKEKKEKVEEEKVEEEKDNSLISALGINGESAEVVAGRSEPTLSTRPTQVATMGTATEELAPDWIPPDKFSHKGPLVLKKYNKVDLTHELDAEPERQVLESDHITWDDRHQVHEMGSEVEVVISNKSKSTSLKGEAGSKSARSEKSEKKSKKEKSERTKSTKSA